MGKTVKVPLVRCAYCVSLTRLSASKRRNGKVWCDEGCGWRQGVRGRLRTDKRPMTLDDAR